MFDHFFENWCNGGLSFCWYTRAQCTKISMTSLTTLKFNSCTNQGTSKGFETSEWECSEKPFWFCFDYFSWHYLGFFWKKKSTWILQKQSKQIWSFLAESFPMVASELSWPLLFFGNYFVYVYTGAQSSWICILKLEQYNPEFFKRKNFTFKSKCILAVHSQIHRGSILRSHIRFYSKNTCTSSSGHAWELDVSLFHPRYLC